MQFHLQILLHLSRLHLNQFYRLLVEIGFARIIILSIIGIIFTLQILPFIQFSSNWAFIFPSLPAFIFAGPFNSRKTSLQSEIGFFEIINIHAFKIRFLRNLLFALPFFVLLLTHRNVQASLIALLLVIVFSYPLQIAKRASKGLSFLRPKSSLIPWTIAIRTEIVIYPILLVVGSLQLLHISFIFISIFIFHLRVLTLLNHNESQMLLESYRRKAGSFLNFYLKKHLLYFLISGLPFLILTAAFKPNFLVIISVIFLLLIIHQWLSVYLKFTFYEPGKDNNDMQSIQTIMLAFLLIPFTIPIPFLYLWRYRKQAIKNLRSYL